MEDSIPLKRCCKCHKEMLLTREYFHANKSRPDGFNDICRECRTGKTFEELALLTPVADGYKRCPHCKEIKLATIDFFHANRSSKSGLSTWCRVCRDRRVPPDKPKSISKGYKSCSMCKNVYPATTEFFFKCSTVKSGLKSACKTCQKQYHPSSPEKIESRNLYNRDYLAKNYTKIYERRRELYQEKKDAMREKQRNIYAYRKGISGTYTNKDVQDQLKRQHGKCYYCAKKLGAGKNAYHVDHIVPVTHAESSNEPYNLVIACPTCNIRKGNKLLHEWPDGGRLL